MKSENVNKELIKLYLNRLAIFKDTFLEIDIPRIEELLWLTREELKKVMEK